MRLIVVSVSQSLAQNHSVSIEVGVYQILRSLVDLLVSDLEMEHVGWRDAVSGHGHGLGLRLGEVFDDPPVEQSVFALQSLDEDLDEKGVIDTFTVRLQALSHFLSLDTISFNVLLDDISQLNMDSSCLS